MQPFNFGVILENLFVILSLIGSYLIAKKNRNGFYYWLVADVAAMVFAIYYEHWSFFVLNIAYCCTCYVGLKNWRKDA